MALNIPQQQAYGATDSLPVDSTLLGSRQPQAGGWRGLLGQINKNGFGNSDLAYSLLANSGPSAQPRSFGQIIGQSMMQSQDRALARQDAGLDRFYKRAQIAHLLNPPRKPVPIVDKDGKIRYIDEQDAPGHEVGMLNGGASTTGDIQRYNIYSQQERAAGREPKEFQDWHQEWLNQNPVNPVVTQDGSGTNVVQPTRGGGVGGITQITTPGQEVKQKGAITTSTTNAEQMSKRNQAYIETGVETAQQLPVLKRSLQLLESVQTGGFDAAKLQATNLFGITGGNEAELSNNLGKAVLSQLRKTFGAQFTEKEGARLSDLEAGFGKSPEGNRRILRNALQIAQEVVDRGADAAEELGDTTSAKSIKRFQNLQLGEQKPKTADEIIEEQRKRRENGQP